jgi:Peptidase family M23
VLLHLAGDALLAQMQPLFGPATDTAPTAQIAAGVTAATVIDVVLPPDTAPAQVGHLISYALPEDAPGLSLLSSRTVAGPNLTVDPRPAITLIPPVHGAGWLSANGCCLASSVHRYLRTAVDGAHYNKSETFAIDWMQLQDGLLYTGGGTQNEQYPGFGASIVSVAAGTVVSIRDGMPEQTPNVPVVGINQLEDYGGNNVVVQIEPNVWAFYAHLQPGSIAVQVGDQVTAGQLLGLLGNTGNSTAPHLHFQLSDGPNVLLANSVPFAFENYTLAGTFDESLDIEAEDSEAAAATVPPAIVPIMGTPTAQFSTYPLDLTVQDFP